MRKCFAALAACLALAALTACAGSELGLNPQGDAGLTNVRVNFNEDGTIEELRWIDGKEKSNVAMKADLKAGTFEYTASDVAAFEAFKSRAEVETYVASKWPEIAPDIRGGITDLISALMGL